ncbi:hypothetical protein [Ornithobacterium rhinotracheale]|uniref:hypothetical protein n=1 Tax=Ornithobacterium rhinotracheale TaxID=28251 RepID=UPI00129CDCFB|nr:hypothetical protein [Ornithobacterium rhinotracheale]MCK0199136.1 hypothetical protein [Ornithobacterium rhinotracheale]MRI64193.1 hypothetical protein [Ornithobacterium rhinotracheale]
MVVYGDDEEAIAKKTAKMLENSLKKRVKSFKEHMSTHRQKDRPPLKDLKVKEDVKKVDVKGSLTGAKRSYFNSLKVKMSKHGFIQNRGASTIRTVHEVSRKTPRFITYTRPNEKYKGDYRYELPEHEFIMSALKDSGIVPIIAREIGRIRGYAILEDLLNKLAENVNSHSSKKINSSIKARYKDREY